MSERKIYNMPYSQYQLLRDNLIKFIGDQLTITKLDKLFKDEIKLKYKDSWRSRYKVPENRNLTVTEIICMHYRVLKKHLVLEIKPGYKLIIMDNWNLDLMRKELSKALNNELNTDYPVKVGLIDSELTFTFISKYKLQSEVHAEYKVDTKFGDWSIYAKYNKNNQLIIVRNSLTEKSKFDKKKFKRFLLNGYLINLD